MYASHEVHQGDAGKRVAFRFYSRKLLGIGVKDWKWTAGFLGRCGRHKARCENLNPVKRPVIKKRLAIMNRAKWLSLEFRSLK